MWNLSTRDPKGGVNKCEFDNEGNDRVSKWERGRRGEEEGKREREREREVSCASTEATGDYQE